MSVECRYCGAKERGRCMVNPGAYRHFLKFRAPHKVRVRDADAARDEARRG